MSAPSALKEARAAQTTADTALSNSRGSRSEISSVHFVQSQGLETEAGLAFLRVVRGSFPTAAIDATGLAELYNGRTRIMRKFTEEKWPEPFRNTRSAFVKETLAKPLPPSTSTSRVLWADTRRADGSVVEAKYVNEAYDNIELDCIVKMHIGGAIDWRQDPDVARSSGCLSFASTSTDASVPPRLPPPVEPTRWRRSSAESGASTCTDLNYHPSSNYYVIGEVFYLLPKNVERNSAGHDPAIQKLVQMEKSLQFLSHKEGKRVDLCVAGALLIGPAFNKKSVPTLLPSSASSLSVSRASVRSICLADCCYCNSRPRLYPLLHYFATTKECWK